MFNQPWYIVKDNSFSFPYSTDIEHQPALVPEFRQSIFDSPAKPEKKNYSQRKKYPIPKTVKDQDKNKHHQNNGHHPEKKIQYS